MGVFTGGSIPTIKVSSNTLLNQAVTGIAGNLADTTLSVALSPVLGAELSNSLGLDPNASFDLGNIVSNGVVGVGQTYLNQIINDEIINSDALGPFGPLVGGLAQNAAGVLTQGVSGLLTGQGLSGFGGLADLFGGGGGAATTASAPNNVPSRAFPGAGDEPYGDSDADYGGSVYNLGSGGPDVVFSIKPAITAAASDLSSALSDPTAAFSMSLGESIPSFSDLDVSSAFDASSGFSGLTDMSSAFGSAIDFSGTASAFSSAGASLSSVTGLATTAYQATSSSLSGVGISGAAASTLTSAFGANSTVSSLASTAASFASSGALSDVSSFFSGGGVDVSGFASSFTGDLPVGDVFAAAGSLESLSSSFGLEGLPFDTGAGSETSETPVWNFIVAPEDISWDIQVATQRVDIFGTNSPPVTVGTKGMRNLSLGNAMIEGFTRARTVEGRIYALEKLTKYTLNATGGFVNVPVYQVFANSKDYGNANNEEGGYFVISDIRIKETMRDLTGYATRAFAEISLIQVPSYQVNTGRDQASKALSAASGAGLSGSTGPTSPAGANQGVGTPAAPAAGSMSSPPAPVPPTVAPAFAPPAVA